MLVHCEIRGRAYRGFQNRIQGMSSIVTVPSPALPVQQGKQNPAHLCVNGFKFWKVLTNGVQRNGSRLKGGRGGFLVCAAQGMYVQYVLVHHYGALCYLQMGEARRIEHHASGVPRGFDTKELFFDPPWACCLRETAGSRYEDLDPQPPTHSPSALAPTYFVTT